MSEKIDIATELVFSSVANIVSDWQATLNAVELVPHTIHINNSVIMDAALGFNKNKTSVRENSEAKMNLFLFLLQKLENKILPPIPATPNKESTSVIVVLDKFATCDKKGSIQLQAVQQALANNREIP